MPGLRPAGWDVRLSRARAMEAAWERIEDAVLYAIVRVALEVGTLAMICVWLYFTIREEVTGYRHNRRRRRRRDIVLRRARTRSEPAITAKHGG